MSASFVFNGAVLGSCLVLFAGGPQLRKPSPSCTGLLLSPALLCCGSLPRRLAPSETTAGRGRCDCEVHDGIRIVQVASQ
jgi:hypothetical protein